MMIDGLLVPDARGRVGGGWRWVGQSCWQAEQESDSWVAFKNKTTKLDKDH